MTARRFPAHDSYVYLIHFNEPYKHARHYLGSTACLESRLQLHKNGNGARLMEVVTDAGIYWQVSSLWTCQASLEMRLLEPRVKHWHGSNQFCPPLQHKTMEVCPGVRQRQWQTA